MNGRGRVFILDMTELGVGPSASPSCRLYPPACKPCSPTRRARVYEPEAGLEAEPEAIGAYACAPAGMRN